MSAPLPGATHSECARAYVGMGMKLVPIPAGKKGPTRPGWNRSGGYIADPNTAAQTWRVPLNMGVVLGPSGLGTLDIDSPEHARIALAAVGFDLDAHLKDGVRIIGNPAKAKVIFRIPEGSGLSAHKLVWPPREAGGKALVVFELRYGPLQDVLPPSVHPETKRPYEWGCAFWENGGIPRIDDQLLKLWREWAAILPILEGACPWAPRAGMTPEAALPSARTVHDSGRREKLLLDLIAVGFDQCERLSAMRWRATEERHLTHDERIAVTNYCKAFDGGPDWALDAIFRNLNDYNARHTEYQFSKTTGGPPLCSTLCPAGQCDAITTLGKNSPIAFAYQARREALKVETVEDRAEDPIPLFTQRMADIEIKPIAWLWRDRLPLGKLVVIAGEPGLGKSRLALSVAATTSKGGSWPGGEGRCERSEVLILNFEDDPADTTAPRLTAEGADLSAIHQLIAVPDEKGRRAFDLSRDTDRLAKYLELHPLMRLVIVDPITACMGRTDSHKNAEVRAALHPLGEVAQQYGVCVLAITHLNKGTGMKAMHRVTGSIAFTAAARVVFAVAKDESDPEGRRLFVPVKNNLGDDRTGFSFGTQVVPISPLIEAPRIVWGDKVTITADEALAPPPSEAEQGALHEAREFLTNLLADGPVSADKVKREARSAGIAGTTLKRAKRALKAKATKTGMRGGWEWSLR